MAENDRALTKIGEFHMIDVDGDTTTIEVKVDRVRLLSLVEDVFQIAFKFVKLLK